jgi:heptosyltransferase-1
MGGESSTLVVRLGAMGDILHALPAVQALASKVGPVDWLVKPQWRPLLEGNPAIARLWTETPGRRFAAAYDFQGLMKSAWFAWRCAKEVVGFAETREHPARWLYSRRVARLGAHVVEHNLGLVGAVVAPSVWLPGGRPEGRLPRGPFVLASPLAGWRSKQWPIESFGELQRLLPVPLVLNGPPGSGLEHESGLDGLLDATRRAAAVLGVDSGPMHLAAALNKPGVALFGPTDPARNGPFGGTIRVLRAADAVTSYRRRQETDASMRALRPEMVAAALTAALQNANPGE